MDSNTEHWSSYFFFYSILPTAFLEITGGNDDLKHALGTGDIASENKVEGDAIVIFKKFDEGRNDLIESLTDVEGIFLFFKKKIEKTKKYKKNFFS